MAEESRYEHTNFGDDSDVDIARYVYIGSQDHNFSQDSISSDINTAIIQYLNQPKRDPLEFVVREMIRA
jgi:hypothetical protein